MIELLIQAETALDDGRLDQAERTYRQLVEREPGNAMAVAGLARVALGRGELENARLLASRTLGLDPENVAAHRVLGALKRAGAPATIEPGAATSAVAELFAAAEAAAAIEAVDAVGDLEIEPARPRPGRGSSQDAAPGPGSGDETAAETPITADQRAGAVAGPAEDPAAPATAALSEAPSGTAPAATAAPSGDGIHWEGDGAAARRNDQDGPAAVAEPPARSRLRRFLGR